MYILVSTVAAWQAEVVLLFHRCCALFWFSLSLHLCFKAKVHCAANPIQCINVVGRGRGPVYDDGLLVMVKRGRGEQGREGG